MESTVLLVVLDSWIIFALQFQAFQTQLFLYLSFIEHCRCYRLTFKELISSQLILGNLCFLMQTNPQLYCLTYKLARFIFCFMNLFSKICLKVSSDWLKAPASAAMDYYWVPMWLSLAKPLRWIFHMKIHPPHTTGAWTFLSKTFSVLQKQPSLC